MLVCTLLLTNKMIKCRVFHFLVQCVSLKPSRPSELHVYSRSATHPSLIQMMSLPGYAVVSISNIQSGNTTHTHKHVQQEI